LCVGEVFEKKVICCLGVFC